MTAGFEFHEQDLRGCAIGRPSGEIDMSNAAQLELHLTEMIEQRDMVVDLSRVTFIDSTGLSAVLVAYHRGQELGHSIRLAAAKGPVRKILEVTQLDTALQYYDEVGDAVEAALGTAGASGAS